jgi:hypothetical protein
MRTHTGDKPFKCREPGCNYEAAQASQLTMHTRTKHTREKPLICDFPGCGRRFAESSNLSKHRKIHEPEEECRCGVCGKRFRRRDQLRRHLKIHVRKDGLSELGARKVLDGGMPGAKDDDLDDDVDGDVDVEDDATENGDVEGEGEKAGLGGLLSPSPSETPVSGHRSNYDVFTEEERKVAAGMDLGMAPMQMEQMRVLV